MRFGKWRGVPLALALAAIVGMGSSSVRADGWHLHYTIPREVPAYDFTTGGESYVHRRFPRDTTRRTIRRRPPRRVGHASRLPGIAARLPGGLCDKCGGHGHGWATAADEGDGSCLGHGCGGLGGRRLRQRLRLLRWPGLFHHGNGGSRGGRLRERQRVGLGQGAELGLGSQEALRPLSCLHRRYLRPGSAGRADDRCPQRAVACGDPGCSRDAIRTSAT